MYLEKFNSSVGCSWGRRANMDRLEEVKKLLQQRYTQNEIVELTGMKASTLSEFMARHGLRRPK